MRILLDTHVLMWAVGKSGRLDPDTFDVLSDPRNEVLFSAVNIWEIAIKFALRRPDFTTNPDELLQGALASGFTELRIEASVAARVADLPLLHRDPFDRLLIAQAIAEPATLYTADARLAGYTDLVRRIAAR